MTGGVSLVGRRPGLTVRAALMRGFLLLLLFLPLSAVTVRAVASSAEPVLVQIEERCLEKTGYHRELVTRIRLVGGRSASAPVTGHCRLGLEESLPDDVFLHLDELAQQERNGVGLRVRSDAPFDVERLSNASAPPTRVEVWQPRTVFALDRDASVKFRLPVHFRYAPPAPSGTGAADSESSPVLPSLSRCGLAMPFGQWLESLVCYFAAPDVRVEIPPPRVLARCADHAGVDVDGPEAHLRYVRITGTPASSAMVAEARIPRASVDAAPLVAYTTVGVLLVCAVFAAVSSLRWRLS